MNGAPDRRPQAEARGADRDLAVPVQAQARERPAQATATVPGDHVSAGSRVKRVALAIAATLVSINIWTGAPLLAVWVGSRFAPASGTSMGAIGIVLGVLIVSVFGLAVALTRINGAYDRLTGRDAGPRKVASWLQSARAERPELARTRTRSSPIERMLIFSVVAGVVGFEVWFFFFARYSIPGA